MSNGRKRAHVRVASERAEDGEGNDLVRGEKRFGFTMTAAEGGRRGRTGFICKYATWEEGRASSIDDMGRRNLRGIGLGERGEQ